MNYPLIRRCFPGLLYRFQLDKQTDKWFEGVKADDLESALEKATRVYGDTESDHIEFWSTKYEQEYNTHSAILLGVERISKKVTRAEIEKFISSETKDIDSAVESEDFADAIELLQRILREGLE